MTDYNTPWPKQPRGHRRPHHSEPGGRRGRAAHHHRSRRHPPRPGRHPALLAPPPHRTAQLAHRARRALVAPRRHHLAATAELRDGTGPTQDREVKPAAGRAGEPGSATLWNVTSRGSGHPKTLRRALARGCPQLSGERGLTCAKTNVPRWVNVPGGTK